MARVATFCTALVTGLVAVLGTGTATAAPTTAAVRFVNAIASRSGQRLAVTLGDKPVEETAFGRATPFSTVPAGPLSVRILKPSTQVVAEGSVDATAGCDTTIVATETGGLGGRVSFLDFPECGQPRIPAGDVSVRVLNMTADDGPVEVRLPGATSLPAAAPFAASGRVFAGAGHPEVVVGAPAGGETYFHSVEDLSPDTAYTIVWAGGGETPLRSVVLLDGVQPSSPPAPEVLINTGDARVRDASKSPPVTPRPAPSPSDPSFIRIPKLGITASITSVPSSEAPTLADTLDATHVAWFNGTDRPGALGISELVGHVAFAGGPAVFTRLPTIATGDVFVLTDRNGANWAFVVTDTIVVGKGTLPANFYAPVSVPTVVLVTCVGDINPATGLRANNFVVVAQAK